MDAQTLAVYDADPQTFVKHWDEAPEAAALHARLLQYLRPGPTADIGCGSGRETGWLASHGYPVVGYDASPALLAQAKARHPHIEFANAALPDLGGIGRRFSNVVCLTVIMHLPRAEIAPAVRRMADIVSAGGVLYLTWRTAKDGDRRDQHGRLYSAFDSSLVRDALSGQTILFDQPTAGRRVDESYYELVARIG